MAHMIAITTYLAHHTILLRVVCQVEQLIAQILTTGYVHCAITGGFVFVNKLSFFFFQFSSLPNSKTIPRTGKQVERTGMSLCVNMGKERELTKD